MLHWMAFLPGQPTPLDAARSEEGPGAAVGNTGLASGEAVPMALGAEHLAWWGLQFTPRVALLEDAVVLEIQASERLFGGKRKLRERIAREASVLGVRAWAHAGTALAALALARQSWPDKHDDDDTEDVNRDEAAQACHLATRLDALALDVLPGVIEHQPTLARLGCRTLAHVRRLPRGGLSRRFGAGLLQALDQAYGLRPQIFDWVTLPPVFDARLELPGRVESAPALLFAAQRLLQQLCAWLAGRQAGITAFTLSWLHDWHRRDSSPKGQWTIRLASPTRDVHRLGRLLAEHLQRIELTAPVGDISLHADAIEALPLDNLALFQEHGGDQLDAASDALITPAAQRKQRDVLLALLDRLSVRLGVERVLQARIQADHRLECTQLWQPAVQAMAAHTPRTRKDTPVRQPSRVADMPQPCWMLASPLNLALAVDGPGLRERPVYQGRLTLLAGPHRIEAGWWDTRSDQPLVTRDYYLASSEKAGLLWIYKTRHAPQDQRSPWFLHGFFA
jgi:protein ImuB